ncbi:MAG TPA: hypothetical protein VKG78_01370 [Opitutaceae bacterium]|nr:hypothetical protein [Opitutaceae bacterium]
MTPTGSHPPPPNDQARARARGAPAELSVDALERGGDSTAPAALERRLTAALGGEAFATLARAEEAFVATFGPPSAGRLCHLPTIRQLLWVLSRLDRYADFGRGRAGAGVELLEDRMQDHALAGAPAPGHLGYFVPALALTAKRWKHTWAPRIKARRRARRPPVPGRLQFRYRRPS